MMNASTAAPLSAEQPLNLDFLESCVRKGEYLSRTDLLALIAKARAAQPVTGIVGWQNRVAPDQIIEGKNPPDASDKWVPLVYAQPAGAADTTVSASIDTPEFQAALKAYRNSTTDFAETKAALIAHIDSRAAILADRVDQAVQQAKAEQQEHVLPPFAAPAGQQEAAASKEWKPVVRAGQVKKGDKLRFKIGDKTYNERAKLILHPGTNKEEVVYDIGRNFYFITSMVVKGESNHKCTEVLASGFREGRKESPESSDRAAIATTHKEGE